MVTHVRQQYATGTAKHAMMVLADYRAIRTQFALYEGVVGDDNLIPESVTNARLQHCGVFTPEAYKAITKFLTNRAADLESIEEFRKIVEPGKAEITADSSNILSFVKAQIATWTVAMERLTAEESNAA